MKKMIPLLFCLLVGCKDTNLTYQQLVDYPMQCAKADAQLAQLRQIQKQKNFDPDPDNLNEEDRAYNSRLKATIWWYTWKCGVE
jgi:hypothetical protein